MTTRSGRRYNERSVMAEGGNVSDLVRMLMEDRQQREEQMAAERQHMAAERLRREEQEAMEKQQMVAQMEVLKQLVERARREGSPGRVEAPVEREKVKLTKLSEQDDIEAYLTTFERMMAAHSVENARWAYKLAPQLTGRAQQAYAALPADQAGEYDDVKAAILRRYDINEETYRQRFRSGTKKAGESYRELATRLCDLATKWTRGCRSQEELLQVVVTEQVLSVLPKDIQVWVRERKPKTCIEAGELAEDYLQARKTAPNFRLDQPQKEGTRPAGCYRCGVVGHLARDCRQGAQASGRPSEDQGKRGTLARMKCYSCGQTGHLSRMCPSDALFGADLYQTTCFHCGRCGHPDNSSSNAMFSSDHRTRWPHSMLRRRHRMGEQCIRQAGMVEGRRVSDILLDTGCSRTLVHRNLVPEEKIRKGETVAIRCAHGNTLSYPLAEVEIEVRGRNINVEAAVSDTLPMAVLLGMDVPELAEMIRSQQPGRCPELEQRAGTRAVRPHAQQIQVQRGLHIRSGSENRASVSSVPGKGSGTNVSGSGHGTVVCQCGDGNGVSIDAGHAVEISQLKSSIATLEAEKEGLQGQLRRARECKAELETTKLANEEELQRLNSDNTRLAELVNRLEASLGEVGASRSVSKEPDRVAPREVPQHTATWRRIGQSRETTC